MLYISIALSLSLSLFGCPRHTPFKVVHALESFTLASAPRSPGLPVTAEGIDAESHLRESADDVVFCDRNDELVLQRKGRIVQALTRILLARRSPLTFQLQCLELRLTCGEGDVGDGGRLPWSSRQVALVLRNEVRQAQRPGTAGDSSVGPPDKGTDGRRPMSACARSEEHGRKIYEIDLGRSPPFWIASKTTLVPCSFAIPPGALTGDLLRPSGILDGQRLRPGRSATPPDGRDPRKVITPGSDSPP